MGKTGQERGSRKRDAEIEGGDLFSGRERPDSDRGADPADRPLDPGDFESGGVASRDIGGRSVREVDLPTVRIDFEGPPHPEVGSARASPEGPSHGATAAAPVVQLPCALLIVDDLPARAARRAAGLMAFGYTCRAVIGSEVSRALTEQRFDGVVLDIPMSCAAGTALAERLAILGGYRGSVVLTTPVWLRERIVAHPQVVAPVVDEALARAIERARASAEMDPKRARGEIERATHVMRTIVLPHDGAPRQGRIRSMSRSGGLDVQIRDPLPLHCRVDVELTLRDGRRLDFVGRVLSIGESQMGLQLELGPGDDRVLDAFVRHARGPLDGEVEPVRIRARSRGLPSGGGAGDHHLARRFVEIAARLDDNAAHQAFIQACVKGQRLEFAVRCYRALKEQAPDDERVHRYLSQVGTIVGFYALRRNRDAGAGPAVPSSVRWALGLFILAALVLWVLAAILR